MPALGEREDLLAQEDGESRAFVNGICNSLPGSEVAFYLTFFF